MRWSVIALVVLAVAGAARAGPPQAERAAIVALIEKQVDAFRRDDGAAAFAFASPGIQARFGTPENFIRMVTESYRPVYRPRRMTFLDLVEADGVVAQKVLVEGPDGETVLAVYPVQRQPDGSWRIDGCMLFAPPGRGT